VLDPRFKSKMDRDEIWERVRASAVALASNTEAVEKVFEFDNAFSIYIFFLLCCSYTVHFFSSCQSQERQRRREWRKRGGLRKFIVANCDEC